MRLIKAVICKLFQLIPEFLSYFLFGATMCYRTFHKLHLHFTHKINFLFTHSFSKRVGLATGKSTPLF